MESVIATLTTYTGDLTAASTIEAIVTGVAGIIFMLCMYKIYCALFIPWAMRTKNSAENTIYLCDLYTSYKAGVVKKTAEEEEVTLIPRPAAPEKNIADVLKEQVKTEISQ